MKTLHVQLSKIDFDDFSCSVWAWSDFSKVMESIQMTGLQTMPVVAPKNGDAYCIVSGHKRLRALKHLGKENVLCRIEDDISPSELFIHTLLENLSFREFNPIEKSMILNKLDSFNECGYDIDKIKSLLGTGQHNEHKIKALSDLHLSIRKRIACGNIALPAAFDLLKIQLSDQKCFSELLEQIDFNQNTQLEIIQTLIELSKLKGISIADILGDSAIRSIIMHPEWNAPQKGIQFREALKKMKTPSLAEADQRFKKIKGEAKLPKHFKILNRPPFEDDQLRMEIAIGSAGDMREAADFLKKASGNEICEKLIEAATACSSKTGQKEKSI